MWEEWRGCRRAVSVRAASAAWAMTPSALFADAAFGPLAASTAFAAVRAACACVACTASCAVKSGSGTGTAGAAGGPRARRTGIAGAARILRGPPPGRGVTNCRSTRKECLGWTCYAIAEARRKGLRRVAASTIRALQPRSGRIEVASRGSTFIKEGRCDVTHGPLGTNDFTVGLKALNQEVFHIVDHGPGQPAG